MPRRQRGTELRSSAISQTFHRTGPSLAAIAPNPVNAVTAVVFDVQGRRVSNSLDAAFLEAGNHRLPLASAGTIERLPSGVYFVRVVTEHDGSETRAVRILR